MRVYLILSLVISGVWGGDIASVHAAKFNSQEKFLDARAPLAPDQDTLLKRAFFNYLMNRPEALYKCVKSLIEGTRFSDLRKTPELFDVFKLLRTRTLKPTAEMSLPFTNDPGMFSEICPTVYGVCQGITNLDRKLAMLIYYDPKNSTGQSVPPAESPDARFAYYEKLITQVMKGNPVVLPGYKNLRTFGSDPMGSRILREAAMKLWASENATLPSITQVLQGIKHTVSKKEVKDLYLHLDERVKLHYPPIIYIARSPKEAGKKWIHVLQVISITQKNKDGSYKIRVKDPNYYQIDSRLRDIHIDGSGNAIYDESPLTEIDLVPGDDQEIARFLVNTLQFCRENPEFCTIPEVSPKVGKTKKK